MIRFWRKRLEKGSVQSQANYHRALRVRLNFIVRPQEMRAEYIELLDRMIKRCEKIINATTGVDAKLRLRAMTVLTELIQTAYGLIRDVEIEEYEQKVRKLEEEAEGAQSKNSGPKCEA